MHIRKEETPKPVQGVVSVSNLPATQPVSGTVTATQGTAAAQTSAAAWPVRLVGGTGDRAVSVDLSTNTLQTIDYEHHEIHSGSAFSYADRSNVNGSGTVRDYLVVTPDTAVECHMRMAFTTEAEFDIILYEDATTSNNGTPATVPSKNRRSATSATTAIFTAPTVTGTGTQLNIHRTGSGTGTGGGLSDLEEWVLKRNTKYLFRFTKASSGTHYMSIRLFFYEHTFKTA